MNGTCAAQTAYGYDGRGNLTSISGGTSYTWDARDRMTGATVPGGSATFAYDDMGHRTQQVTNGVTTNYLWDEASPYGDVIRETSAAGAETASYILGGTELILQRRSSVTNYYLQDGQGSTRTLMDVTGAVQSRYVYDAFGNLRANTGTTANVYWYTGQQWDQVSGIYSLRARYYSPGLGRFGSRDQSNISVADPTEADLYSYTANSPTNLAKRRQEGRTVAAPEAPMS